MAKKQKQQKKQEVHTHLLAAVGTRGRTFEGFVTKRFTTRIVLEFERTVSRLIEMQSEKYLQEEHLG